MKLVRCKTLLSAVVRTFERRQIAGSKYSMVSRRDDVVLIVVASVASVASVRRALI